MDIIQMPLTMGVEHGRSGRKMVPSGIVVHYVANPGSSATANRKWFENGAGGARTSAHYIIGIGGDIIQCLPDYEQGAHAGVSYGAMWNNMARTNNLKYIGIECCHPDATGKFSQATINSLAYLVRHLCDKHGLDISSDVFRHYDVCGKKCPMYYVNNPNEWMKLMAEIKAYKTTKPETELTKACDYLSKNDIMNSPDYWKNRVEADRNLESLIIKMAKKLGMTN